MMATKLIGGWLDGARVRTARKPHKCEYWRGRSNGGTCEAVIAIGDQYCEGALNDTAGGFGMSRYCFACAGYDPSTLKVLEMEAAQ